MRLCLVMMHGMLGIFCDQVRKFDKPITSMSREKLIKVLQQAKMEVEVILVDL